MSLTELTGNPRHDQLLMLIAERGYMNIDELANLLDVSTQTVRRDIRKLSDQCEECDDDIPEGRRRHVPGVRLCVPCQTRLERLGR